MNNLRRASSGFHCVVSRQIAEFPSPFLPCKTNQSDTDSLELPKMCGKDTYVFITNFREANLSRGIITFTGTSVIDISPLRATKFIRNHEFSRFSKWDFCRQILSSRMGRSPTFVRCLCCEVFVSFCL